MDATEIFTPGEFPRHTYVELPTRGVETRLRDALKTPGEVVSVSGPSKSGKTVLVERVVGPDELISVSGAGLTGPDHLWERVLDWMEAPTEISEEKGTTLGGTIGGKASGKAGFFEVVKGEVEGSGEVRADRYTARKETRRRGGLPQVVREIGGSPYVLLLDDFHYMPRAVQTEVAKQIKEAARAGVKIVAASVPHRSDDVVRSNPELRGRVRSIDLAYWDGKDLEKIADTGFPLLNIGLDPATLTTYAVEASGSPQLMQAICLQQCYELDARETLPAMRKFNLAAAEHRRVLGETATRTDYSSLLRNMHTGPKKRGTERKVFSFGDGTKGDVYRCVLLAIAADPPRLGLSYNELTARIQQSCARGDVPQAASVYQACEQISQIARTLYPDQRVVEWDLDESRIDIVDPYFLFFIRWSSKLRALAG